MEKKRAFVLSLALFLVIFLALNFISVHLLGTPLSPVSITGKSINGSVRLFVDGGPRVITIYAPLNQSYDFSIGDSYLLSLDVTADFFVDEWKYSVYDIRHGTYNEEDTPLTPNSSFVAVRWDNRLTVSAFETDRDWVSEEVVFFINVPNSAPILGDIDSNIYVCEGEKLEHFFNATDADEEVLYPVISPKPAGNPFHVVSLWRTSTFSMFKIFSGTLDKDDVGSYNKTVSVDDLHVDGHVDSAVTNITVIEINNVPSLTGLGAQTVWLQGVGSEFNYQFMVSDTEDGGSADGNLSFNLTWGNGEDLFDVSSLGVVNYTPENGEQGSYSLTICATDNPLSSAHENISLCSPRDNESETVCDDFTLTVTDSNRAPTIVSYSPIDLNFSEEGTTTTTFNVTVSDDDMVGTYPDIDWYVDGVLVEENEGVPSDEYALTPGCGVSGDRNVTVIVSDGAANVSQSWNVMVSIVACPVGSANTGGGGGGGGGGSSLAGTCNENWVCNDWDVCQNVKRSFDAKSLSPEDYYQASEICVQNHYDERFCGFQIASCYDISECENEEYRLPKPSETRVCYFTENPNCRDGITNCHDGSCELLVDCGGPCEPCATCSDGIQNQGEGGADCGGPCPYSCEKESPFGAISYALVGLLIAIVLILLFIIYKILRILGHKRATRKSKK
jgi:hypothetical protein